MSAVAIVTALLALAPAAAQDVPSLSGIRVTPTGTVSGSVVAAEAGRLVPRPIRIEGRRHAWSCARPPLRPSPRTIACAIDGGSWRVRYSARDGIGRVFAVARP